MKPLKELLLQMYNDSKDLGSFISISEALKRKIEKQLIYPGTTVSLFEEIRSEIIKESVFDPIQNVRSEELFDKNEKMKPEAKKQIMDIVNE
jgi:hypothetical protein